MQAFGQFELEISLADKHDAVCYGTATGSVVAKATGGSAPYTFFLNGTEVHLVEDVIHYLPAGNYTLIVKDVLDFSAQADFIIAEPPEISPKVDSKNATCGLANGQVVITPPEGIEITKYIWSDNIEHGSSPTDLLPGDYTITMNYGDRCQHLEHVTIRSQGGVKAMISNSTNASCFGVEDGSATVDAKGTGNFTYAWSPSGGNAATASNLAAGNYSVMVTDEFKCTTSASVQIMQPDEILTTITKHNATCNNNDGDASISVTNPSGSYTYLWTPGNYTTSKIARLAAGAYTVTVTDEKGCTKTTRVIIDPGGAPKITAIDHTDVLCNGQQNGTAMATVTGGTGDYIYKWNNGSAEYSGNPLKNVPSGKYSLTVTDVAGCSATGDVTINQPAPLTHTVSALPVTCTAVGSGEVKVTGGTAPYIYLWKPGNQTTAAVTRLAAGDYEVYVYDKNYCEDKADINILSTAGLTVSISDIFNVKCKGGNTGSATVKATGTAPYIYSWSVIGGKEETASNLPAGYYTVTVTDHEGCSANATVTITEPTAIATQITTVDATCGNNNGSAKIEATGGEGSYTFAWQPGNYTGNEITNVAAGTYAVTVTDANGCTKPAEAIIKGSPSVSITGIVPTDASCNGQSSGSAMATVTGGAGGYTYKWTNGTIEYAGNPLKDVPGGKYQLNVTDVAGCSATGDVTINQPAPLAHIVTTTTSSCGKTNGSATITERGGTAPYTYAWSPSGANEASVSGLAVGDYQVVIYDKNHCGDKANIKIVGSGIFTASIKEITNVSCNGGKNGSATAYPTGAGPYQYTWSPSGGNGQTAANLPAGDYTVTVTDNEGCAATATATITEATAIATQITTVGTTCGNNNGSAKIIATGGAGSYTFAWQPGNYTGNEITNVAAGTYAVKVTDANGCTKPAEAIIKSSSSISISSIVPIDALCNGQSSGSATATAAGGTGDYIYKWTNGTIEYTGNPLKDVPAGNYQLSVTNAAGCSATGDVTINQAAPLAHTVKITPASCANQNGTATITETGGTAPYTYAWNTPVKSEASVSGLAAGDYICHITDAHQCAQSVPVSITSLGGLSATITNTVDVTCYDGNNGSATVTAKGTSGPFTYAWSSGTATTATANDLKSGNYTVTVTDRQGCTATASTYVAQPSRLKTTVTSTNTTCNNNNGSAMIVVENGATPYSYAWLGANQNTASISNLAAAHYVVTVTDAHGCSAIDSAVIAPSTTPLVDKIIHTDVLCHGNQDGTAIANVSGGMSPYNYLWTNGSSTFTTATIRKLAVGTYNLQVTDAAGCPATASTTIAEPPELKLSFATTPTSCGSNNGAAVLNVEGGTSPYNYRWSTGNRDHIVSNLAAGSYYVSCTDANGCVVSAKDIKINSSQPLKVSLGRDTTICPGNDFKLFPGNYKSYIWQDNSSNPAFKVERTSVYTVTVTDSIGCTASASVKVEVNCSDVVFPSAFTPNGDGHNDTFGPLGSLGAVKEYTLTIYNRWGQQVFLTNDPYKKWDGKFNASDGGTGTYVWIAAYSFNGQQKRIQKGTITIIK